MKIFGADPGASGGIALLDGDTVKAIPTPLNSDNQIDLCALTLWLDQQLGYNEVDASGFVADAVIYVENVHSMPGQGVASSFQFGRNLGKLEGVLGALHMRTAYVSPQAWKKKTLIADNVYMGLDIEDKAKRKVIQKKAAIAWVQQKFPDINLVPPRCRVPSDGMAEALCIAYYGYLVEPSP